MMEMDLAEGGTTQGETTPLVLTPVVKPKNPGRRCFIPLTHFRMDKEYFLRSLHGNYPVGDPSESDQEDLEGAGSIYPGGD